nr:uncharacterized protein CI109_000259 [Kwoniella shandongensis]KAA5531418.1 hypothetical protein CI109_000259 [Kwoniella shandongensis]
MPAKRRRVPPSRPSTTVSTNTPITSSPSPSKKPKTNRYKTSRSIWTSTEDWDTLVTESALSTSSISTRAPRPRGLHSLVKCATDAAGRGFKRLWEQGEVVADGEVVVGPGKGWREAWLYLPDHLKEGVRDRIFRWWGGYLTLQLIHELFSIPPRLILPGELLPSISKADYLKTLIPTSSSQSHYTHLILTHASSATDIGLAGLIYHLPDLEVINLKGCTLAGSRTVQTIMERCGSLKRVNLKGTKVGEKEVGALLRKFGKQLEGLKVDDIVFENINETFDSGPYPSLRHLCLPGKVLNPPTSDFRSRARIMGHSIGYPHPRPTPDSSIIQWSQFSDTFPALTHLYLPGLLIPEDTIINLTPHTLIKLSIGPQGPPVPVSTIIRIVESQSNTLKSIHLGNLLPLPVKPSQGWGFDILGEKLKRCEKLEEFRLQADAHGSKDVMCDQAMGRCSDLVYGPGLAGPWRRTLKRLSLQVPQGISAFSFLPVESDNQSQTQICPLEQLDLPSADIDDTALLARALTHFPNLRSLDLSGTTITDDDMKVVLEGCGLLSRVDLTSCRGINVRHRRNIFKE